tara:strand:+ start:261 stop:449 length:189 start_codon:yes stop_codon:yes gene_type:complete
MAEFSIIIADSDVGRVIAAMCANYGYTENIPNPDFIQACLKIQTQTHNTFQTQKQQISLRIV